MPTPLLSIWARAATVSHVFLGMIDVGHSCLRLSVHDPDGQRSEPRFEACREAGLVCLPPSLATVSQSTFSQASDITSGDGALTPGSSCRYPVSTHRSRVLTRKGGKSWPRRTST